MKVDEQEVRTILARMSEIERERDEARQWARHFRARSSGWFSPDDRMRAEFDALPWAQEAPQ